MLLLQWSDLLERLTGFHFGPIRLEIGMMKHGPLPNQPQSGPGLDVPDDHPTVEIEFPLLALKLGVEMRRLVLLVKHPHDDSKEDRNDGHTSILPSSAYEVARSNSILCRDVREGLAEKVVQRSNDQRSPTAAQHPAAVWCNACWAASTDPVPAVADVAS